VAEADIAELDKATIEPELLSIWGLLDLRLLLEHVEEVLNIYLRLGDFPKEHSHVEKRLSKLHEVGLE